MFVLNSGAVVMAGQSDVSREHPNLWIVYFNTS
jgi:hypothetical protein